MHKKIGELSVFPIGQGTGDKFWNHAVERKEKIQILRRGIEYGMNLIDTAEGYGNGTSETIVGEAVDGIRNQCVLASKFSPEHSAYEDVVRAAEETLKRLKTDRIDLYQLHWLNPHVPLEETMRALKDLLKKGKIRCAGVSNFSKEELAEAQKYLGEEKIASLQTEFNLTERTVERNGLMDYCQMQNVTLLAYSPLDQGRFSQVEKDKLNVLEAIAGKHAKTPAQVILRRLVHCPPVVALTRTVNARHLKENVEAMNFDLSKEEIEEIDRAFSFEVINVPVGRIRVSTQGEWNHPVYQTLEEALQNKQGFVPSPLELAEEIKKGRFLKPVRLVPAKQGKGDYELIGGRIRYWAWVIAKGRDSSIPAVLREELESSRRKNF